MLLQLLSLLLLLLLMMMMQPLLLSFPIYFFILTILNLFSMPLIDYRQKLAWPAAIRFRKWRNLIKRLKAFLPKCQFYSYSQLNLFLLLVFICLFFPYHISLSTPNSLPCYGICYHHDLLLHFLFKYFYVQLASFSSFMTISRFMFSVYYFLTDFLKILTIWTHILIAITFIYFSVWRRMTRGSFKSPMNVIVFQRKWKLRR